MSQGKPRKIAMKNNGQLMRGGEVAASSSSSSATREGRRRRDSSLVSPPPMMVQERVLEGLERASEEEEQQQEENQELEPGMMLRQPLDVVATIDSWTADWMVQEQVDKREAELVESWLSRMLSKVLKMEEEENVAEEQQQQQQHSSLPLEGCGLRGAGLDRKRLMERGMPANHIDFVYRALYAHSAGFYETLHGGQGFKVDAEEMERLSVAFKLLMNLMQQGTTDAAAAIIPALYSSPDDASKLDGNKQPTHHSCHSSSGYSLPLLLFFCKPQLFLLWSSSSCLFFLLWVLNRFRADCSYSKGCLQRLSLMHT